MQAHAHNELRLKRKLSRDYHHGSFVTIKKGGKVFKFPTALIFAIRENNIKVK
jgi:hypothetical protein